MTEYLRGGELTCAAVEMVGRAGFKFTNLACGLNLQPACRGMNWRLSIYGAVNWLALLLRWWVAGFKFYEFSLRPEPATSLPRYGLATEYLRGGELT
ncbi:hypothetical protein [Providencia hangzhouensis]|uniref:hypothetical protein n=1 Tax=Providencia hangzhouensis TaxID=3031799 RepID=UPI0034DD7B71